MSKFLKIVGGILLAGGIIWGVFLYVAAATQMEGYETLTDFIPGFAGHGGAMLVGMVLIGLGQRFKKQAA